MMDAPNDAFPTVHWEALDADATFLPGEVLPPESQGRLWAVLVFLFYGDKVVLADIPGRGHCIPSGRIEPGESIYEAAVREVYEETGARLQQESHRLIGCYRIEAAGKGPRYSPVFIAEALGFEPLPPGTESLGMMLCAMEDMADLYYTWDPLMDAVFAHAAALHAHLVMPGLRISEITE